MTRALALQPSPLDRLDPVAAAVRWWTSRLGEVFAPDRRARIASAELEAGGKKRLSRRLAVELPEADAFVCEVVLPKGAPDAHAKAMALRAAELAPVDPDALMMTAHQLATTADGSAVYAVAMARRERLAELEAAAHARGARDVVFAPAAHAELHLRSAETRRRRRRGAILDAGLLAALALASSLAASAATGSIERQTAALIDAERAVRAQAVAAERARRDAALSADLIARGVLERRAGAVLGDLAALNAATPEAAFWTRAQWRPGEVMIFGQSLGAAAAIEALSAAAEDWSVALSGAVRAASDASAADGGGAQAFDLRLTRRPPSDREDDDAR